MNQKTPMHMPPRQAPQRRPSPNPQPPQPSYGKILVIIMAITVALLVISLIVLGIALAIRGGDSKPKDDPAIEQDGGGEVNEEEEGEKTPSSSKGAVATNPSRTDYTIPNASGYDTISGISSKYAILLDLNSYEAVAGISPDTKICPASMTKVMTLLVACENIKSQKEKVPMSDTAVANRPADASGLDWKGGEMVSVEDLLYLVFLRSDTVASITLAEYVAGSESAFVKMMNEKAAEIGCKNTRFSNSTGLYFDGEEYYSTCRDMAMIMAYALDNPLAKKVMTQTGDWYLPKTAPVESIKATWLTDRFASKPKLDTVTIKGAKTGYETAPGACLVSYAVSNSGGGEYIMVIVGGNKLGSSASTADVKAIYKEYAD